MGISPSSITIESKKFSWCDPSHPFLIPYNDQQTKVFPLYVEIITFTNKKKAIYIDRSMLVDERGFSYMSYWEKDKKSTTPGQRKSVKLRVSNKIFHQYKDGLATLERSIRASLFKGEGNTDLLSESYLVCDAIGTQLQGAVSLEKLTSKEMLKYLEQFEAKLARKSSAPLAEARDKVHSLLLWVRDKEGQPKLVIFRTKWTAILERHKERIETIQAWSKVYAVRLYEIILIRERFSKMLLTLELRIIALREDLQKQKKMTDEFKASTLELTPKFISELQRWNLLPYKRWAAYMRRDIGKLEGAVRGNSRKLTLNMLDKLDLAIRMKQFHEKVDLLNQHLATNSLIDLKIGEASCYSYDQEISEVIYNHYFWIKGFIEGTDDKLLDHRVMPYIKKDLFKKYKSSLAKEGAEWSVMLFTLSEQHERLRELLREISRLL